MSSRVLTPGGRYADLMKQGFMKPIPARKPVKLPSPMVACSGRMNWHRKNQHTATVQERRENRKKLGVSFRGEQRE